MKDKKIIIALLFLIFPCIVSAYKIEEYDTYIEVSDNKIMYRENINVNFNGNETIKKTLLSNKSKDIFVSTNHTIKDNIIKIDNNGYNNHKYNIKYSYKYDYSNNYEINIGNTYNASINSLSFNIELPKNIKEENISFYLNDKEIKDIEYRIIDGNKVYGEYGQLKENDELILSVNYTNKKVSSLLIKISIVGPIIFVLISYILWLIFGKDRLIKIEKTSIPPRRQNPLELALMYNGNATTKDIVYMILELSSKGYIKIEENNKNFKLIRLKQYNGSNYKESVLFKSIFAKNNVSSFSDFVNNISNKNSNKRNEYLDEISINELKLRMPRIKNNVLSITNSQEEKNKYFEKEAETKKVFLSIMLALILFLVTSIPFIENGKYMLIPISIIFSIITLAELITLSEKLDLLKFNYKKVLFTILILLGIWIILLIPILNVNKIYILSYIIGTISTLVILILYKYMPKRSIYATRELGRIEGLKLFINTAKDEELERVLNNNEHYFYEILPYTYILGCNNKLYSKMKHFEIKKPDWYDINGEFTVQKLSNSIDRLIKEIINNEE